MNDQAINTTAPLDCTSPLDTLLELTAWVGREEAIIDDGVLTTAPTWSKPRFEWSPLINQFAHGPIAHLIPEKIYAFTSVAQAEDVPELGAIAALHGTFIVGPRMKAVIDAFDLPKSELFPIGMVLRDIDVRDRAPGDDPDRKGGGAVVEGRHWLWHLYSRYELVDWGKSEQEPYWIEKPRDDLPGSPVQRFSVVNNNERTVLYTPPYNESAAFQILGNKNVFISPALAFAMRDAGVLYPGGGERYVSALILAYHLDRQRQTACLIARRQQKIDKMPPIRIVGTEMMAENTLSPPFGSDYFTKERR